jgi:hypothetical protein
MSLQARLTESANNLTTNEPGTGTESIEVTTITEPTTKDGTDTNFAHPETPINNTDLKPQSSPISLLEEIIASYEALQLISQPTKSDIETARTLRRKAETLLSNQRLKSKNDALQSNTSIDSEILEKISVQSLTISDESTETPAPTQIISSTTIPDSGTTPEQTENLPNTTISPTNSTDKTQ